MTASPATVGQILKGNAIDILVDDLVQTLPEMDCAALTIAGAFVDGVLQTGHRGKAPLNSPKDVSSRVIRGGSSQPVSAASAPGAL